MIVQEGIIIKDANLRTLSRVSVKTKFDLILTFKIYRKHIHGNEVFGIVEEDAFAKKFKIDRIILFEKELNEITKHDLDTIFKALGIECKFAD